MEPSSDLDPAIEAETAATTPPLRIGDYLWHPWYAKAWWIAIPLYWLPAGTAMEPAMQRFYTSGFGIATNIILMPITAGLVLGFGYLRRLLAEGEPADTWFDYDVGEYRKPGMSHPTMDETDPRSGPQWIGYSFRERGPH
ncbi:hypothetical protein M9978_19975 [Sphingomonas sp. MG17]|uniref:Uncharacterized protein n=1 Tax=Sphingomonas tagetis TaxID=2949092 RepID=A0A9X2KNC2_9SPHN|nr:hypothetical protein [Sphingomonas tagetis]MCP3732700.1 hypothetical protein [Sphingomonas tagetis]